MSLKSNTVLIIDDDTDSSSKIAKAIEAEGYMAFTASSGDVALTMAKKVKPGLVFLNLAAPKVSGLDICKDLHSVEGLAGVPIILLTLKKGGFDPRYKEQYGIFGFLKKPFEPDEVKPAMDGALAPEAGGLDKAALLDEAVSGDEEITLDLGSPDADSTMVMEGAPSFDMDEGPSEAPQEMDFGSLDEGESAFPGVDDEELDTGIFDDEFHIEDEDHSADHDKTMVMGVTEKPALKPQAPKPAPKAEAKPAPAPKAEPKPAPKAAPAPAPKPAPKPAAKPEPKKELPKIEEEPSFGGMDIDTGGGIMPDTDFGLETGEEGFTGPIEDVMPQETSSGEFKAEPGVYIPKKRLRATRQSLMPAIIGVAALILIAIGIGAYFLLSGGETRDVSQLAMVAPSRPMAKPRTSEPSLVAEATAAVPPSAKTPAAEPKAPAPAPTPAAKPSAEAKAPAPKPPVPAPTPAPKAAVPVPAPAAPKPVVIAPPVGKPGMYYVQYGLFKNAGNAERLARDLKSKGLTASIMREGDLNRVVGDSFASKAEAQEKVSSIKSAHNIATAVYLVKGEAPMAVAAPKAATEPKAAVAPAPKAAAAPAPTAGAPLTQKYYVQYGAFGVKANAEKLAAKLNAMGIDAFIYFDSGRNLSLVLSDGYSALTDAQSRAKTIKETNGVDTSVYKGKV